MASKIGDNWLNICENDFLNKYVVDLKAAREGEYLRPMEGRQFQTIGVWLLKDLHLRDFGFQRGTPRNLSLPGLRIGTADMYSALKRNTEAENGRNIAMLVLRPCKVR